MVVKRKDFQTGILIVGHGSRRAEANEDLCQAAHSIGKRGSFALVQPAFLEIEQPNVAEGFARLVAQGAREIIVHPYFLSPGRHTRGDLPRKVSEVAAHHRHVRYRITEPLSAHPLVIEASIERIREESDTSSHDKHRAAEGGRVYLVGGGPGDVGLLTLRARDLLTTCDVVLYDYLVDADVLQLVTNNAERIAVGKIGGGACTPQAEINRLLIEQALAGKRVIRLKGGDPFLFGRGGEEAEALYDAGIPFEIVPGISSALAVPAYAGIPLTHRGYSSSVAVITGSHAVDGELDARALFNVADAETIVVLMGLTHLREIATELVVSGKKPETPAAVIRWGTYDSQQTVVGSLESIAGDVERVGLRAPAVIVIGEVVRLRERVRWFEKRLTESSAKSVCMVA